jgi:tRNA-2-methylthio-N6-dimethylallyladenosine synthase
MDRISAIKRIIPDCELSTDIIAGFCGETEEEHRDTISLLEEVGFIMAYHFKYSERPRTLAERKFEDDIPEELKSERLTEIIAVQRLQAATRTKTHVGRVLKVLVEGPSKKNPEEFCGRTTHNSMVIFPKEHAEAGMYVNVKTSGCTTNTLLGTITTEEAEA